MNLRESAGIALGALRANKLRSLLTLLGTIIGVMSVITVVSVVEGLNHYISDKILNVGANVFQVDKFGLITNEDEFEAAVRRPDVTLEDADVLRANVPHAAMVVAQAGTAETVHYRNHQLRGTSVRGRGAGYEITDDLTIAQGRHLSALDDDRRAMVCVVGPEVVDELFPGMDPLGKQMRIGDQSYEVVGVTEPKGKMLGQSQDRFVTIPIHTFAKFKQQRGSFEIEIKSLDAGSLPVAQEEVRTLMRGRRHLRPGQPDNFGITTSETLLELYRNITGNVYLLTIGVAAISLLVGGIVIMNIMLVSVTERTREIGVRKALGARRRDILAQFLVEATTLSLTGGVIGIVGGIGLPLLARLAFHLPFALSWPAVGMGIVMSTMIGVFFGSYPATRAARLDPIEALRYE